MHFELLYPLPTDRKITAICVSGGVDSMACLRFLSQNPRRNLLVLHINHNTDSNKTYQLEAQELVRTYCNNNDIKVLFCTLPTNTDNSEARLRKDRYEIIINVCGAYNAHAITCHTLDDCVEQFIIESVIRFSNKKYKIIPYSRILSYGLRVFRPFRTWAKKDIYQYAKEFKIPYLEDPTNFDGSNLRSKLRNTIIKPILELSPGLYTHVKNILKEEMREIDKETLYDGLDIAF